ncbi:hypothetical protein JW935_24955 [candidate division KSB1 bacterium]|nr:hypothetical protein [candidate division KSB1 bacterium]
MKCKVFCMIALLVFIAQPGGAWDTVSIEKMTELAALQAGYELEHPILKTHRPLYGTNEQIVAYSASFSSDDGKNFHILLSADRNQPPVFCHATGHGFITDDIDRHSLLAQKKLAKPEFRKIYYFGFGEVWYLFTQGEETVYVNSRPPGYVYTRQEFDRHRNGLKKVLPRKDVAEIQKHWQLLINGISMTTGQKHRIPMWQLVPDFDWHYGCSPTAAADVLGYYDIAYGYANLLRYFYLEYDGLSSHADDYTVPDLTKILKEKFGTTEGGATVDASMGKHMRDAAMEQDGNYNWGSYGLKFGEIWEKVKEEVNGGYPSVLNVDLAGVDGFHSMPVFGYEEDPDKVLLYDTWNHLSGENWWSTSQFNFSSLAWVHPPLTQTEKGITLTALKGEIEATVADGETVLSNRVKTITWDCDRPGFGKVSIYLSTNSGNSPWNLLADLTGNPGQWDWMPDLQHAGQRNRLRIKWFDDGGTCIGEDASYSNFEVQNSSLVELRDGQNVLQYWPDGARIIANSNQWGIIALYQEERKHNELQLYATTEFTSSAVTDVVDISDGRIWGMCAVNLGPPNPPSGPFGVQVTGEGKGYLQYVASKELGWGVAENTVEYWGSDDYVKAYHLYVEENQSVMSITNYVFLENLSSADFEIMLFDMTKRYYNFDDNIRTANTNGFGGNEKFILPKLQPGRFLVVVRQRHEPFKVGSFRLTLDSESGYNITPVDLNKPDTLMYSSAVLPMPAGPDEWYVAGVAPLDDSKWKIQAGLNENFDDGVTSALGGPNLNFVVVKRPPAQEKKSSISADKIFLRLVRMSRAGRARLEILSPQDKKPFVEGENRGRQWPANRHFHLVPINSTTPLCSLVVRVWTDDQKLLRCGIIPMGVRDMFSRTNVWGQQGSAREEGRNVKSGFLIIWSPKVYKEPFTYHMATKIFTGVETEPGVPRDFYLTAYPNPFVNRITVTLNGLVARSCNMEVYDICGRKVYIPFDIQEAECGRLWILDTRSLTSGAYFIRAKEMGIKPVKVMKVR